MRYSKELLNEKYKMLPKSVKDMMGSLKTTDAIKDIVEKHKLHITEANLLYEEITYIMVGAVRVGDFIKNIKVQFGMPDEQINAIAKDVNEKIFIPMREAMKREQGVITEEESVLPEQHSYQNQSVDEQASDKQEVSDSPQEKARRMILEESRDIKRYLTQQRTARNTGDIPADLPTPDSLLKDFAKEERMERSHIQSDVNERVRANAPEIEKATPYSEDPYREPINTPIRKSKI